MEDLLRFGGVIFGVLLFLLAALFVTTRIYIHSFKRGLRTTQVELKGVQAELEAVNRRIKVSPPEGYKLVEEMESIQVQ